MPLFLRWLSDKNYPKISFFRPIIREIQVFLKKVAPGISPYRMRQVVVSVQDRGPEGLAVAAVGNLGEMRNGQENQT